MNVRVKMHGVLGRHDRGRETGFDLALADDVTAGDLLRALAERCGAPFRDAVESSDSRFPRHIRMFADGEMLSRFEQPLVTASASGPSVTVVLLSPMMGG
jgi:hypothetical protein